LIAKFLLLCIPHLPCQKQQQSKLHLFIMALPPRVYQFLVAIFASLGSLLYGYDLGVIAEVIASGNFKSKFGDDPNATYVFLFSFDLGKLD
jgi:hypothetical protein